MVKQKKKTFKASIKPVRKPTLPHQHKAGSRLAKKLNALQELMLEGMDRR